MPGRCIIPGCTMPGIYVIAIRARKPNTNAVWAPNTNAYLCQNHVLGGVDITITVAANTSRSVTTHVAAGGLPINRTTPITRGPD